MTDDSLFLIDIDKILRAKAPKRYNISLNFCFLFEENRASRGDQCLSSRVKDKLGVDFLELRLIFWMPR